MWLTERTSSGKHAVVQSTLVVAVKLAVSPEERAKLLSTMEKVNEACNAIAKRAFARRVSRAFAIHKLVYYETRKTFGLSSQLTCRAIAKVAGAYKRDRTKLCRFRPDGGIAYDARCYGIKDGMVSILALGGRVKAAMRGRPEDLDRLRRLPLGEAKLVRRKGKLFLHVSVDVGLPDLDEPEGTLGVDLGIKNVATDSDGETFAGDAVEKVRQRYFVLRQALQACGTKSAKRHLKRLSGKEARFRTLENHRISKRLVAKAKGTHRQIALEDLTGIRDRVTVRKSQRAKHSGWSFFQLRAYLTYKAMLAGVPVLLVDPRNTSRSCPACGLVDKLNRPTRDEFCCIGCGHAGPADHVAARNIAARADVNRPIVSAARMGNVDLHLGSAKPHLCQGQSLTL